MQGHGPGGAQSASRADQLLYLTDEQLRQGGALVQVVAECEVLYSGRAASVAEAGEYVVMLKADGSVQVQGPRGVKPVNWQPQTDRVDVALEDGVAVLVAERFTPAEFVRVAFHRPALALALELGDNGNFLLMGTEAEMQRALARDPGIIEPGLMVLDMGDFSAVSVDTRDGTHAFRHSLGGMFFGTSMQVSGDSLLLGGLRMGDMGERGFSSADAGLWIDLSSGEVTSAAQAPEGTADRIGAAVQGQQVLPQPRDEPGRLRDGADHLAPAGARRAAAQGRQGDRGLRQPHLPQSRLRAQPDAAGAQPARTAGVAASHGGHRRARVTAVAAAAAPTSGSSRRYTCAMSEPQLPVMTSHRPYLLRALYEWIVDNGMTPHILVDATRPGVRVPSHTVNEGRVVLNIAERAVARLEMDNDSVRFTARFGGVSQSVSVPVSAVLAVYARETGQGMVLPDDIPGHGPAAGDDASGDQQDGPDDDDTPPPGDDGPPRRGAHLRVVK